MVVVVGLRSCLRRRHSALRRDWYSQRLEESPALDDVSAGLDKLTKLAVQRLTFDARLHGEDDRDLDLLRLLHTNHTAAAAYQ